MSNKWQIGSMGVQWNDKLDRPPLCYLWNINEFKCLTCLSLRPPHLNLSCFCFSRPLTPFFPPILHNNEEQRLTAPNSFPISLFCLYICLQHLTFPCFTFSLTLSAPHPYLSIPPSFPFHFHFLGCSPSNASFPNVIASCPNFLLFSTGLL